MLSKFLQLFKEAHVYKQMLFYSTIFLTGVIVLVIEIIGARIMSVHFGSTVYVWSSLITVAMAGLSVGYWLGGLVATKDFKINIFSAAFYVAGVYQLGALLLSGSVLVWSNMFGIVWGPLVASTILFMPPIVALGLISPYAVKVRVKYLEHVGGVAGNLYALSTIGSLAGGLLAGFVFAPIATVSQIAYYNAFAAVLIAFLWMMHDYIVKGSSRVFYMVTLLIAAVLLLSEAYVQTIERAPGAYVPIAYDEEVGVSRYPVLFETEGTVQAQVIYQEPSQYGDVVVFDSGSQYQVRCFLIDGVNETCWNFLNNQPSLYVAQTGDTIRYLQEERETKKVLVIGVGGATMFKYLDGSGLEVDGVEINEKMEFVAEEFFGLPESLDMEITIDDGRHFLVNTDEKYDVIVMDICFVNEANVHLWTTEFYALAKERLTKDGVIIATRGMVSGDDKMERLDHMTFNALTENFAYVYSGNRFEDQPGTFYMGRFIASDKPLDDTEILGENWPINVWQTDSRISTARDEAQLEMLDLVYPATEAILQQSRQNYGERLLLPL